jgi:hypothetical protein
MSKSKFAKFTPTQDQNFTDVHKRIAYEICLLVTDATQKRIPFKHGMKIYETVIQLMFDELWRTGIFKFPLKYGAFRLKTYYQMWRGKKLTEDTEEENADHYKGLKVTFQAGTKSKESVRRLQHGVTHDASPVNRTERLLDALDYFTEEDEP